MISKPELELRWASGFINLMGWNEVEGSNGDYLVEALAEGTEWGNPEPVRRVLRRFLLDGSTSVKEYDNNREVQLSLSVSAASGEALTAGETALDQVDGRRCELIWTPPTGLPAVFLVDSATLKHVMDDEAENTHERFYTLTLDCLPHAYSPEWVEVPALVQGTSTRTEFDAGTSLSGWDVQSGSLLLEGGGIRVLPDAGQQFWTAIRTGSVNFTSDRYLTVTGIALHELADVQIQSGTSFYSLPRVGADGSALVFDTLAVMADEVWFRFRRDSTSWGGFVNLLSLGKQATPRAGAARQQIRTLAVPGARRTPASILVESPTTGLGTVIVYSGPAYNPDMSRGATSARITDPDSLATLSGAVTLVTDYEVPSMEVAAREIPRGDHSVWVRARSNGAAGTLTVTAKTVTPGGSVIFSRAVGSARITDASHALKLVGGGELLPSLPEDSSAKIRFEFVWAPDAPGTGVVALVDTLLVFNRTRGSLTIAEAGSNRKLWIDAATLTTDHPVAYVGSGDKADAVPLSLVSQLPAWHGAHTVEAPVTYLYGGATGAGDAAMSGAFRAAWHTHPGAQ